MTLLEAVDAAGGRARDRAARERHFASPAAPAAAATSIGAAMP